MNPIAKIQTAQYARSVADLFKLMIQEKEEEFRSRIKRVFDVILQIFFTA